MRYICNKYNLPDHWYPADLQKRSKVDEYLSWHHTNTRLGATDIIWGKVGALLVLSVCLSLRLLFFCIISNETDYFMYLHLAASTTSWHAH